MIIKDYYTNNSIENYLDNNSFYFDIETMGLSSNYSPVILICLAIQHKNNKILIRQYFAENISEEKEILYAFSNDIINKNISITFNGNSFDIPYIKKRCEILSIKNFLNDTITFDIYQFIKPLNKQWELENLKLKTIESFFNIKRNDMISGKESIELYKKYINTRCNQTKNKIMNHNYEDVLNLITLNSYINKKLLSNSRKVILENNIINIYIYNYKLVKDNLKVFFNSFDSIPSILIYNNSGDSITTQKDFLCMSILTKKVYDKDNNCIIYRSDNNNNITLFLNSKIIEDNIFDIINIL